ncbi:MAG: ribosome assembly factor SBDS [Nanoarchaeota archaeon]
MAGITYDPEKFQLPFARLQRGGHVFEVVVDQDKALQFRSGKQVAIVDVLKYEKIFAAAQKGQLASENAMSEIFGTEDPLVIAERILKDGDLHLTAKFRKEVRERKRRSIVERIHRFGVDPRTKAPHPVERIERAMAEKNVHIDEFAPVEQQAQRIAKEMVTVLPISFERKRARVELDAQHAAKAYGVLKQYAHIQKESWTSQGGWVGEIEFPAGLEQDLYDRINNMTQGQAVITSVGSSKV